MFQDVEGFRADHAAQHGEQVDVPGQAQILVGETEFPVHENDGRQKAQGQQRSIGPDADGAQFKKDRIHCFSPYHKLLRLGKKRQFSVWAEAGFCRPDSMSSSR